MQQPIEKIKDNFYQFDVLRGIAIIGVILVHCQYAIYPDFDFKYGKVFALIPSAEEKYKYLSMSPLAFGWMGVMLFFLISGFLIHYTTLKRGIPLFDIKLFFNKRFWRIYPLYFITLIFFALSKKSLWDIYFNPSDFISHLFLVHNFAEKTIFSINGVFWSLAVEVQLYLLYPVFLYASVKIGIKNLLAVLFILGLGITVYWWYSSDFKSIVWGNSVLRHWFVWGLGAFLAESFFKKEVIFKNLSGWILVLLFLLFYLTKLSVFHLATDHYFSAILILILIEKYLYKQTEMKGIEKILIPVGLCSYSLYLFHMPFLTDMYYAIDILHFSNYNKLIFLVINIVPVFTILYFMSYSSYLVLETRSISFGNRIFKKITGKS